jgi:nucleoside-diphosphate-sugar epimerase
MKKVFITGGTGFIGANLVRRLLNDGHDLNLLVRPGYTSWRIQDILKDIIIYTIDLCNKNKLEETIKKVKPDWVFHLAAYGAYPWQTDLTQMLQTNILGTINLVEICSHEGYESFISAGSSSEYGFKQFAPSEVEWLEPNSNYAVTKASASLFCCYTAQSRNLPVYTLRLYSVYGPYEEPKRLIPALIRSGMKSELPPLVNPDISHDFIYVDDVVDAFILVANQSNQKAGTIYNIGSGIQTPLYKVVELTRQVFNLQVQPNWNSMSQRNWDTYTWIANIRKANDELNWKPKFTLEQGFMKTVQWYFRKPEYLIIR